MSNKFVTVIAAAAALGLFLAVPASAQPSKNGDGGHGGGGYHGGKNGGGGHGHGGGGRKSHGGGGGGGGGTVISSTLKCAVNGEIIRVGSREDCYKIGGHVIHGRKRASVAYSVESSCDCETSVSGGAVVRYYAKPSNAAVMQAKKRARRAAAQQVIIVDGGYGGGYYDQGQVVVVKKRKKRVSAPVIYQSYNPGVVIHYGPIISKSGGY